MADLVDLANDFVDNELAFQVHKIRERIQYRVGSHVCTDCEGEIPQRRRELGYDLCIHCAEAQERRDALFPRE